MLPPPGSNARKRIFRTILATAVAAIIPLSTALPASAAPEDPAGADETTITEPATPQDPKTDTPADPKTEPQPDPKTDPPASTPAPAQEPKPKESPKTADSRAASPLVDYVNPFIGTQDEGNAFPGASVPFGMVQLSPDNGHNLGYDYGRDKIRGFSMVHLSGAGCGIGGTLPILPTTGAIGSTNYSNYALKYSHDDETAKPGYYQVGLETAAGKINAELTATEHGGVQRYAFPATAEANVMINPGQALNTVVSSSTKIIGNNVVETRITQRGFCQSTPEFTIFTRTEFNRPFASFGTWSGDTVTAGSTTSEGTGRRGAYVRFDTTTNATVESFTSMSYVDPAGVQRNMAAEKKNFDDSRTAATALWEDRLNDIEIDGGAEATPEVFYSALYRSLLHPNTGTDVDRRYTGWDQKIHTATDFTYYQNFSLWDTYRTQQQLLTLLAPTESRDMALSVLTIGEQYGVLPRWGYGTVETNIMTGDPVTAFLVSAWDQGMLAGHEERAYQLLKRDADAMPPEGTFANGRAGNDVYLKDGFVPYEPGRNGNPGDYDLHHGGSATLEYALSDGMLATMAKALGHDDDAKRYSARGQNYKSIFDPRTGAFRARNADGMFVGSEKPAEARGFHEGTAVQYQWLVQQDMPGIIELLGGKEKAEKALDAFFAYDQVLTDPEKTAREVWVNGSYDYYNQDKYNPNNEPDLHSPYVYLWTGQPWKSSDVVRAALTLFTNAPTGVTGNEDLGTMAAWYVLSAIGIFPMMPGSDIWGLSTPVFEKSTITLDPAFYSKPQLTITAPGVSRDSHYVQSVSMGGKDVKKGYVQAADLAAAGTLDFKVGSKASTWATSADASPGTAVTDVTPSPERVFAGVSLSRPVVKPNESTEVVAQIVAQGAGTVTGELTVTAPGLIKETTKPWSTESKGLPSTFEERIPIQVPPTIKPGSYPITLTVTDKAGNSLTREVSLVVGEGSFIAGEFNNVGIGDQGKANANFDNMGAYYLRDRLATAGIIQGQRAVLAGTDMNYVIGAVDAGQPDNIRARGQVIAMPDYWDTATKFTLVGAGNNGTHGGDMTVTYKDGSADVSRVELTDWCSSSLVPSNTLVARAAGRGQGTGVEGTSCGMFYATPIEIPTGKQISSITLPDAEKMHVFAIASDAVEPMQTTTTLNAPAAPVASGAAFEIGVTVAPESGAGVGMEGSVELFADGVSVGTAPVVAGIASFSITAGAARSYEYTATFTSSTDRYLPSRSEPVQVSVRDPEVAAITISAGSVRPGDTISIAGSGFGNGEKVSIVLHSTPVTLGEATADASGIFALKATIPKDVTAGMHKVRVEGLASGSVAEAALEILPAEGVKPGDPAKPGEGAVAKPGDKLPVTGVAIAATLGLAALLLAAGFVLRHRRRASDGGID